MGNALQELEKFTTDLARAEDPVKGGGGIQAYDIVLRADNLDFDYDLQQSWVGVNRWHMLTRQYVSAAAHRQWLGLIYDQLVGPDSHGVATMRSNLVAPRQTGKKVARRWGSCMLSWSFRVFPTPHLTMHSRSTYLGFLAPLDLAVAAYLADEAAEAADVPFQEVGFTWLIEQATFHAFRSMPWWFKSPQHESLMGRDTPAANKARRLLGRFKQMDEQGVLYGDMAYAQERRFRMKLHSETCFDPTPYLGQGSKALVKTNPALPHQSFWDAQFKMGE